MCLVANCIKNGQQKGSFGLIKFGSLCLIWSPMTLTPLPLRPPPATIKEGVGNTNQAMRSQLNLVLNEDLGLYFIETVHKL